MSMSRLPVDVKFNEKGDGVKVGDCHVRVHLDLGQSLWREWLGRYIECRITVRVDTNNEERYYVGKAFTL